MNPRHQSTTSARPNWAFLITAIAFVLTLGLLSSRIESDPSYYRGKDDGLVNMILLLACATGLLFVLWLRKWYAFFMGILSGLLSVVLVWIAYNMHSTLIYDGTTGWRIPLYCDIMLAGSICVLLCWLLVRRKRSRINIPRASADM